MNATVLSYSDCCPYQYVDLFLIDWDYSKYYRYLPHQSENENSSGLMRDRGGERYPVLSYGKLDKNFALVLLLAIFYPYRLPYPLIIFSHTCHHFPNDEGSRTTMHANCLYLYPVIGKIPR